MRKLPKLKRRRRDVKGQLVPLKERTGKILRFEPYGRKDV